MSAPPENRPGPARPAPSGRWNRYTIAKGLVAAGLLVWLVGSGRLDLSLLFSIPLNLFHGLGMLVLLIAMVLQACRWWWLLDAQQIDLSLPRALGLVWIGRFLALLFPGVMGGDLVVGYYVIREAPSAKTAGLSTVVLDRAIGFYTSFLLGLAAVGWMAGAGETLTAPVIRMGAASLLCVVGATGVFGAVWADPVRRRMLGFVPERFRAPLEEVLKAYRARGRNLLYSLGLSLIVGFLSMGAYRVAGQVIGTPLGWKQVFMVCPLVFLATALPVSPGGIGVGEAAASVLFAQFGVETGAAIMLVVRAWFLALRLPGALFYVFRRRHRARLAS